MILKHAIKYLELTGSDFITDLKDFADLQNSFVAGYIPDDFTEQMESFTDKLLILWVDCNGGLKNALDDKTELPTTNELINIFCKTVFIKEKEDKGKIRQEYGILCGMVGIFLNILLFCGKFFEKNLQKNLRWFGYAHIVCGLRDLYLLFKLDSGHF